ncbi:MAG: LysR family transcriptional regulator [Mariprofundaceae bacterium]|nr:LysR family transcriptional regulator [Mariprofundaceae bacterium]
MTIHPDHLLSFVALVQTGSVSGAAQSRFLTQPAISNQLKRLQKDVGMPLYRRQGRGVQLTAIGEAFYTHALKVQQSMQDLNNFADELHGLQAGRIHLSASQSIAGSLLPAALVSFHQKHPHIEVFVDSMNSQQVFERMEHHDLGLVESPLPSSVPECCTVVHLGEDKLVTVMPMNHPLVAYSSIELAQLEAYPLIWREQGSGTRDILEKAWMTTMGKRPRIQLCMGGVSAVLESVRQGLGIGMVSQFCLPTGESMLTTRPLYPQLLRPMSLLQPSHASPLTKKLVNFLIPYLKSRLHASIR